MASRSTLKITLPQVFIPPVGTQQRGRCVGPRFAKIPVTPEEARSVAQNIRDHNVGTELPMVLVTETVL